MINRSSMVAVTCVLGGLSSELPDEEERVDFDEDKRRALPLLPDRFVLGGTRSMSFFSASPMLRLGGF